jgi:hypothetical protein
MTFGKTTLNVNALCINRQCAECRHLFIVMLNVIMPCVSTLDVIMLSVSILVVITLNIYIMNVIMLNAIMLNVIMQNIIMLNVIKLSRQRMPQQLF